jgi:hypothetical protein
MKAVILHPSSFRLSGERSLMDFWNHPVFQEVARQVLIALLLALLSVLGYDRAVVQPRIRRLESRIKG